MNEKKGNSTAHRILRPMFCLKRDSSSKSQPSCMNNKKVTKMKRTLLLEMKCVRTHVCAQGITWACWMKAIMRSDLPTLEIDNPNLSEPYVLSETPISKETHKRIVRLAECMYCRWLPEMVRHQQLRSHHHICRYFQVKQSLERPNEP